MDRVPEERIEIFEGNSLAVAKVERAKRIERHCSRTVVRNAVEISADVDFSVEPTFNRNGHGWHTSQGDQKQRAGSQEPTAAIVVARHRHETLLSFIYDPP